MADKNTKANARIRVLEAANAAYILEISRLQARLGELSGEVGRLQAEMQQKRGVLPAVHALYRAVDTAILRRIENRGYRPKAQRRSVAGPIAADVLASDDLSTVSAAAARYDAEAYFRYRTNKSTMRLGYRILGGAYRGTRDVSWRSLKAAYHLTKRGRK